MRETTEVRKFFMDSKLFGMTFPDVYVMINPVEHRHRRNYNSSMNFTSVALGGSSMVSNWLHLGPIALNFYQRKTLVILA